MVILTVDCVEKKCSQIQFNRSLHKKDVKSQLWKLTHLYMNDMFISTIGNFAACRNVKVIYLQNNEISKIENLHFASGLTHLYLQHNRIRKIENLDCLRNLRKLYLGYNNISVIEGLENQENLIELHVENQRIASGESLCFDPRSARTLSMSLKILDISGNKMTSLSGIANFHELEVLEAKDNQIDDIADLTETICTLISLKDLSLQGNPVTHCYRYRENLIANTDVLTTLDGKAVTDVSRHFLKRFRMEKQLRRTRRANKIALSDDITQSLNLPPAFKRSISRAILQRPGPKLSITVTPVADETRAFPPWKSAPAVKALKNNHIMPRPFWGNIKKQQSSKSLINGKHIVLPPI